MMYNVNETEQKMYKRRTDDNAQYYLRISSESRTESPKGQLLMRLPIFLFRPPSLSRRDSPIWISINGNAM